MFLSDASSLAIGFGDITPKSTAAIVFCIIYTTVGIINVGLVVNTTRETVIEAFENAYRKRASEVTRRRHENKIKRQKERQRRLGIERELAAAGLPLYVHEEVPQDTNTSRHHHGRGGGGVNLTIAIPNGHTKLVLNEKGLEAWKKAQANNEKVPEIHVLDEQPDTKAEADATRGHALQAAGDLKAEVAAMATDQSAQATEAKLVQDVDDEYDKEESYSQFRARIAKEERKEFFVKVSHSCMYLISCKYQLPPIQLTVAWATFALFWFVGAGIFVATEKWSYGRALYFCWMSFSTVGYGEIVPQTPAGKAIFVVWALMGTDQCHGSAEQRLIAELSCRCCRHDHPDCCPVRGVWVSIQVCTPEGLSPKGYSGVHRARRGKETPS